MKNTTILSDLEDERNRLLADLFATIRAHPFESLAIQVLARHINRIDRQIAEARQSDASSADPLEVGA